MKKVLCFGEILLRLSPDHAGNWLQNASMPVYIGGAELNVAQALARWDIPVSYFTAMPDSYLAESMQKELLRKGIDISKIITHGDRIGIYYLAQGTDLKNSEVIYDRSHSSTASLLPGQVDWDAVLEGVEWFHFTAITPAVNENLARICKEALLAAVKKNITISVDLNYRSRLWKWGKEPLDVMPELVQYCHVVMGNIWAAEQMLGIKIPANFSKDKQACLHQALESSRKITSNFTSCTTVANTFRFDQGDQLNYYATLYAGGHLFVSRDHTVSSIVDKVGSGDCFMGGLIYGTLHQLPEQEVIDFAAAAAVDKMFVMGDATTSGADKIKARIG